MRVYLLLLLQNYSTDKRIQNVDHCVSMYNFSSSQGIENLSIPPMLLNGERLFEMAHEVTTNVVNLRPLSEHEYYAQHNKRSR